MPGSPPPPACINSRSQPLIEINAIGFCFNSAKFILRISGSGRGVFLLTKCLSNTFLPETKMQKYKSWDKVNGRMCIASGLWLIFEKVSQPKTEQLQPPKQYSLNISIFRTILVWCVFHFGSNIQLFDVFFANKYWEKPDQVIVYIKTHPPRSLMVNRNPVRTVRHIVTGLVLDSQLYYELYII